MATTVGQYPVSAFTTPRNGDPLDASVVVSNDNTTRVAYVNHDADPGIHVQSSALASRPAASVAGVGAKWITADTGDYRLWYSDGTTWYEVSNSTVEIEVLADANLVAGDVVKVTGYNNGQGCPTVNKVASASDVAFGIVDSAIGINTKGYIINTGLVRDINTNAFTVGTILYPNTSGGFTSTKPTSGSYQVAAYVLRQNTNNGVVFVEFSGPRIVERSDNTASTVVLRDASGNFSAGTITAALTGNVTGNVSGSSGSTTGNAATATKLATARNINGVAFDGTADITVTAAAGTLTGNTLASGVTASSLTSVGTLTNLTVTNPITGSVTGSSGSATGNAATATKLAASVNINGVAFDGSANITVTADAGTLTGSTLASGVTASSLTSVGTLASLAVTGNVTLGADVTMSRGAANRLDIATGDSINLVNGLYYIGGNIVLSSSSLGTGVTSSSLTSVGTLTGLSVGGNASVTGDLTVDSGTLKVDSTNNRVGINQASPSHPFQIGTSDFILTTGDNVGIGRTPNSWTALFNAIQIGYASFVGGTAAGGLFADAVTAVGYNYYSNASPLEDRYIANGLAAVYTLGGGTYQHRFFIAPNGSANAAITFTQALGITQGGGVVVGTAALTTTATDGFLYVPTCAGQPTGTPTSRTGTAPIVVDTTNHKLYFYSGGTWRDAGP